MNASQADRQNRSWIQDLGGTGPVRELACRKLYALLLRAARAEVRRRAAFRGQNGPELEDIAHEAAADALMSISRRLDSFRGESKFTTWATRFVIFGVASKMRRRPWWREEVPYEQVDWRVLIAPPSDLAPEEAAQLRDLVSALAVALRDRLSERQRIVFVAAVLEGVPIGALAEDLGSTRNSLYKVLFDARRNLRAALVTTGHLPEPCLEGSERSPVREARAT